jgi:zinc transporter ZupT
MLGGFFLQLLLEQFSSGVEHGHIHSQQHLRTGTIVSIMFGLCVHAFFEGIPLQDYDHFHEEIHEHSQSSGHFLYAIVLHKAPAAFALVLLLLLSNVSRIGVIICLLIFAGMTPLGALVASFFELSTMQLRILIAVVVGSFLHIATTILFEMDSTDHHQISFQKMLAIGIGLGIAVLTIH